MYGVYNSYDGIYAYANPLANRPTYVRIVLSGRHTIVPNQHPAWEGAKKGILTLQNSHHFPQILSFRYKVISRNNNNNNNNRMTSVEGFRIWYIRIVLSTVGTAATPTFPFANSFFILSNLVTPLVIYFLIHTIFVDHLFFNEP